MESVVLALTAGEPAGIGADICLQLDPQRLPCKLVIFADKNLLRQRAQIIGLNYHYSEYPQAPADKISVCHIPTATPVQAGCLNAANAPYVLQLLDAAYRGICRGDFAAMVTAPLHKGIINDAHADKHGHFSGHTEYLARISGTEQVVMMLAGGSLRVALATTHLPLREVADALNAPLLEKILRITAHDLREKFHIAAPRILVCGLNPHAGEGGHLGREEIEIITPVLQKLRAEGFLLTGPAPADTAFLPQILQQHDAVLAMYHDQGLPVLKHAAFGRGINVTLGLPFIRTSVDHGTALELAGTGRADAGSLYEAIDTAYAMAAGKTRSRL